MEKLKFSMLKSGLKIFSLMIIFLITSQNVKAWADRPVAIKNASVELGILRASLDPINPSSYTVLKMKVIEDIITDISIGNLSVQEAFNKNVVFDTTGQPNTPTANPAVGIDSKKMSGEIYNLLQ